MWLEVLLAGTLTIGQGSSAPTDAQPPSTPTPSPVDVRVFVPPPAAAPATEAKAPAVTAPDRWLFMREAQGTWVGALLDDHRMSVSGWVDASFTASTDRHDQLPMGFNFLANQGALQQGWVRVERTVDQTATTPTFGFRSDTFFGIDYRFTLARGLADWQLTVDHGEPNQYGYDPVQFYAEAYFPHLGRGTDVKVGRFFCQFGVEVIDATQNQFVSHAYNFIYNPFTHTGLLTTLKLSDAWSVQNGIVTGADMFIAPGANPTYVGSVKWAPPTGRDSVLFAVIVGKGSYDVTNSFSNPEIFDLVYVHKFSDRLTYTVDALYSFQYGYPGAGASGFVNNWGVVQYLTYQLTPKLSATGRLEFFDDVQGQRTGFKGLYKAVTTGVTYKPTPYLWLRPEVRFDNNADSRPFEGKPNLFTAAFDCILRW